MVSQSLCGEPAAGDQHSTRACTGVVCGATLPEVKIRTKRRAVIRPSTLDFEWSFLKYARSCLTPKKKKKKSGGKSNSATATWHKEKRDKKKLVYVVNMSCT